MKKYFLFLIILISFFYLSQNTNAVCIQTCALHSSEPADSKECYTLQTPEYRVTGYSAWSCSVNEKVTWEPRIGYYYMVDNCAKGKNVCLKNACPSISYTDIYVYNQADGLRQQIAGESCLSGTTVTNSGRREFVSSLL